MLIAGEWRTIRARFSERSELIPHSYTLGLASADAEDVIVRRDLYRNRALSGLILGSYDLAKTDALACLSGNRDEKSIKEDMKGLYRAARAAYELNDFTSAEALLTRLLKLSPNDEDGRRELQKTITRGAERNAKYDFAAIAKSMPETQYYADHADFTSRTYVHQTDGHGRGLFANTFIPAGDLILCEKAFVAAHGINDQSSITLMLNLNTNLYELGTYGKIWAGTVQKLLNNPSLVDPVLNLHAGDYPKDKSSVAPVVDGAPVVDAFHVQAIIECNSFGFTPNRPGHPYGNTVTSKDSFGKSTGLWVQASYMNHSCLPNAHRSFIGDLMILRAIRDIPRGTEICVAYRSDSHDVDKRHEDLQKWGFQCSCGLCDADVKSSAAQRSTRNTISESICIFVQKNVITRQSRPSNDTFAEAEVLLQQITATYPEDIYHGLPRLAIVPMDEWFVRAYSVMGCHGKVIQYASAVLRDLGYQFRLGGSDVIFDRANCILSPLAVDSLMYIAGVKYAQGYKLVGEKIRDLAKEAYRTLNGELSGFDMIFGTVGAVRGSCRTRTKAN